MDNFSESSMLKSFIVCGLMNKAQMKRTVLYGTARTGDCFIWNCAPRRLFYMELRAQATVLYGTARTGDCFIWNCAHRRLFYRVEEKVAVCSISRAKDCRWVTVCTNKTQRNIWGRAHERQTMHSHPMQ